MRYSALGVHVFMGGLTLGFSRALDVKAQLEIFDLGKLTVEHNLKLPFVHVPDFERWRERAEEWRGVDVLFGNPRCTGFSALGHGFGEATHGPWAKPTIDIRQLAEVAGWLRPPIWGFESVQQAGTVGRDLIEWLHETYGRPGGYRLAELYHNVATFGSAQHRRRVYFVWYRNDLQLPAWELTEELRRRGHHVTNGELLSRSLDGNSELSLSEVPARIVEVPHEELDTVEKVTAASPITASGNPVYNHYSGQWQSNRYLRAALGVPLLEGTSLNGVPPSELEPIDAEFAEKRRLGVSFSFHAPRRLHRDGACPVIYSRSDFFLHPWLPRPITLREMCRFMGLPDCWTVIGGFPVGQIGKGVCVEVGEWLGRLFAAALRGEKRGFDAGAEHEIFRLDREAGWTPKRPKIVKGRYPNADELDSYNYEYDAD